MIFDLAYDSYDCDYGFDCYFVCCYGYDCVRALALVLVHAQQPCGRKQMVELDADLTIVMDAELVVAGGVGSIVGARDDGDER